MYSETEPFITVSESKAPFSKQSYRDYIWCIIWDGLMKRRERTLSPFLNAISASVWYCGNPFAFLGQIVNWNGTKWKSKALAAIQLDLVSSRQLWGNYLQSHLVAKNWLPPKFLFAWNGGKKKKNMTYLNKADINSRNAFNEGVSWFSQRKEAAEAATTLLVWFHHFQFVHKIGEKWENRSGYVELCLKKQRGDFRNDCQLCQLSRPLGALLSAQSAPNVRKVNFTNWFLKKKKKSH